MCTAAPADNLLHFLHGVIRYCAVGVRTLHHHVCRVGTRCVCWWQEMLDQGLNTTKKDGANKTAGEGGSPSESDAKQQPLYASSSLAAHTNVYLH